MSILVIESTPVEALSGIPSGPECPCLQARGRSDPRRSRRGHGGHAQDPQYLHRGSGMIFTRGVALFHPCINLYFFDY